MVFGVLALAAVTAFTAGTGALVAGMVGSGARKTMSRGAARQPEFAAYYLDMLFRTTTPGAATPAATRRTQPRPLARRATCSARRSARILTQSLVQGRLADEDRAYVARVVAARTGLSAQEAERRVTDVESRAREAVEQTADKAAKAASYFSFWTFMALLFGAMAAVLGGLVGGELRDQAEVKAPAMAR